MQNFDRFSSSGPNSSSDPNSSSEPNPATARLRYERTIARPGARQHIRWTVCALPEPDCWAGTFEAPGDRPRIADACESPLEAHRLVESMTVNWLRYCPVADVVPLLGTADTEIADCLALDLAAIPVLREISTACGLFPDLFHRVLKALGAHEVPDLGWSFPAKPA